jgi:hypothetical protein
MNISQAYQPTPQAWPYYDSTTTAIYHGFMTLVATKTPHHETSLLDHMKPDARMCMVCVSFGP